MTEFFIHFFVQIIKEIGYVGVFILMTMESMIFPIPSEAVMPFAGFLIFENQLSWSGVFFSSLLGSLLGSSVSYILGLYGGRAFILQYGSYFLLEKKHLEMTERFFYRYGEISILISRFIPVIRHLISIPAGIGKMNFMRFLIFTAIGASLWNIFLAYIGYILRSNWIIVSKYMKFIDISVVVIVVVIGIFISFKVLNKSKN